MAEEEGTGDRDDDGKDGGEEDGPEDGHDPGLAEGGDPAFKWYVAKTMTGQEGKVAKALRENVINQGCSGDFSRILVPVESVTSHRGGKKRTVKRKFFPSYILIKMVMNERTWHVVNDTDKITGFVGGTPKDPRPISDDEAAFMTDQSAGRSRRSRALIDFHEGDQVKVVEGPFASFVGTVDTVGDKDRIKVNVSIFGRPTPVDLELSQVEKIS